MTLFFIVIVSEHPDTQSTRSTEVNYAVKDPNAGPPAKVPEADIPQREIGAVSTIFAN